MKITLLILCLALTGNELFAMGQADCSNGQLPFITEQGPMSEGQEPRLYEKNGGHLDTDTEPCWVQGEYPIETGGFAEADTPSWNSALLTFIEQTIDSDGEEVDVHVVRMFRQTVRGVNYIVCGWHGDDLVVWLVHWDISGEFSLLRTYRGKGVFDFLASFIVGR